jgi:hypothetical protein
MKNARERAKNIAMAFANFRSRFRQSDGRGRPSHIVARASPPALRNRPPGEALGRFREFLHLDFDAKSIKLVKRQVIE